MPLEFLFALWLQFVNETLKTFSFMSEMKCGKQEGSTVFNMYFTHELWRNSVHYFLKFKTFFRHEMFCT